MQDLDRKKKHLRSREGGGLAGWLVGSRTIMFFCAAGSCIHVCMQQRLRMRDGVRQRSKRKDGMK